MILDKLNMSDMPHIVYWRNKCLEALRTPRMLTYEMQEEFYKNVICDRKANSRYWALRDKYRLVGMCGIENIEWENRLGEISLIINPNEQRKGYGAQAVELLLEQGFDYLNLENIYAECYTCNPALEFWDKMRAKYCGSTCTLPNRKYWAGRYYDSIYFNFDKRGYHATLQQMSDASDKTGAEV